MQLIQHSDGEFAIRAIEPGFLLIGNTKVSSGFCLSPQFLETNPPYRLLADFQEGHVAAVLAHDPSVVLLGTGSKLKMPQAALRAAFLRRGVGVEAMDLRAACYTYNVLAGEHRAVILLGFFD
jgi:uncharacterized protein